ncbi:hypothetical protein TNCV_3795861 [Trichonephila clavipes]|nr:hypothetical protein TNCV_3795861 [Trichonephila clavipes]
MRPKVYCAQLSTRDLGPRGDITILLGSTPNLEGEHPGGGQVLPTSFPLPTTSREGLWFDGCLEYSHAAKALYILSTSVSSPGFEPRPYRTAVKRDALNCIHFQRKSRECGNGFDSASSKGIEVAEV